MPHRSHQITSLYAVFGLPLIVGCSSCAVAQDDRSSTKAREERTQSIQQDISEEIDAPIQLADYPGAPFEDRDGNLWFSTVLKGLIKYDGTNFTNYTTDQDLPSNMIRGMLEAHDGTLYFATSEGLVTYDGKSFSTMTEYEPLKVKRDFNEHGNHRNLSGVTIDRNGTLWIATLDGAFKHDGKKFVKFPMPVTSPEGKYEFASKKVSRIYEDQQDNLWFATDGAGVIKYDGQSMTVYTSKDHGLASDNVNSIFQDSTGDYWFGTANGGISHYDGTKFTTHLRENEHSIHHGYGRFFSIIEDHKGNIWFGAAYSRGGVYRFDGTDFQYLSTESGLGNGGVPSIRKDRSGNLWFGTTAGVYHYDGERFINFTKNDPRLPASFKVSKTSTDATTHDPVSIEDWASETIPLPPGFAPDMPTGVEELRFAPGWRDPDSESFWSYAVVMWIDESVPDAARVGALLESYYSGLMSAFGVGREEGADRDHVQVEVVRTAPNHFEASMHLIDGFATFEPIDLRVLIDTEAHADERSIMSVRISAQGKEHPVWRSLEAAITSIRSNGRPSTVNDGGEHDTP